MLKYKINGNHSKKGTTKWQNLGDCNWLRITPIWVKKWKQMYFPLWVKVKNNDRYTGPSSVQFERCERGLKVNVTFSAMLIRAVVLNLFCPRHFFLNSPRNRGHEHDYVLPHIDISPTTTIYRRSENATWVPPFQKQFDSQISLYIVNILCRLIICVCVFRVLILTFYLFRCVNMFTCVYRFMLWHAFNKRQLSYLLTYLLFHHISDCHYPFQDCLIHSMHFN